MSAADPTTPDLEALLDQGRLAELRGQTQSARDLYERALHSLVPGTPAWTIARRYGQQPQQLLARNGLSSNAVLQPGMVLKLEAGADEK